MSSAQEKANLARIRENQRRSRSRRKEYLQELEARLRQCKLQGVETSAEIQLAARRVADENRKLRGLLAQHGIGDKTVEAYLKTTEPLATGYSGGNSRAVQHLEHIFTTRKNTCAENNGCGLPSLTTEGGTQSRNSSANDGTVQSFRDRQDHRVPSKDDEEPHQRSTPSSTFSLTGSVRIGYRSSYLLPHLQNGPANDSTPRLSVQSQVLQDDFDHQSAYSMPTSYNTIEEDIQARSQTQISPIHTPTANATNASSCVIAADMITTMAGVDPQTVRAELGCMPDVECQVDNQLVFSVMDRYTGGNTVS